jgi:hypothetical protein
LASDPREDKRRAICGGDEVSELSALRCYELFSGGCVAFQRGGRFYFGPIAKLFAFLSGSSESFLTDEAAEERVAEIHAQQGKNLVRSVSIPTSETDGLATTRQRWEHERRSGHWGKESK